MTLRRKCITSLLTAALVLVPLAGHAGPVERELRERGGDVGTPDLPPPRNEEAPAAAAPNDAAPSADQPETGDATAEQPARPAPFRAENANEADTGTAETAADTEAPPAVQDRAFAACLAELQTIAEVEPGYQPEASDPECTVPQPVILKSTKGPMSVDFTDGLLLSCPFALANARFVRETVQPLARHHIGAPLTSVGSGQGFVCRRRNNAATGKLSEHAFGNATDWISFSFEGEERLDIRDASTMKPERAAFFNAVRKAACGAFTTVLGPGSNAAHATHLHFDLGRTKSGKKNPYRICE